MEREASETGRMSQAEVLALVVAVNKEPSYATEGFSQTAETLTASGQTRQRHPQLGRGLSTGWVSALPTERICCPPSGQTSWASTVALGTGVIEGALDDRLLLLAIRTGWMVHSSRLTRLFPIRHSSLCSGLARSSSRVYTPSRHAFP